MGKISSVSLNNTHTHTHTLCVVGRRLGGEFRTRGEDPTGLKAEVGPSRVPDLWGWGRVVLGSALDYFVNRHLSLWQPLAAPAGWLTFRTLFSRIPSHDHRPLRLTLVYKHCRISPAQTPFHCKCEPSLLWHVCSNMGAISCNLVIYIYIYNMVCCNMVSIFSNG